MSLSDRIASRLGWTADRVERFVALARGVVAFERIWPALWPASGLIGLWLAAGLFGLFAYLPAWLHLLTLLGFVAGIAALFIRHFQGFSWPDWHDGARRLERDSALAHRPVTEGSDTIAVGRGDPYAEALWRGHLHRLLARIANLRVSWPRPGLAEKDPRALRFAVLLLLVAGFAVAGRDWPSRLASAFLPDFGRGGGAATLDAWIDPPAYTGVAPIYLASGEDKVSAPAGSRLILRVHGAIAAPRADLSLGRMRAPGFHATQADGQSEYATALTLSASTSLAVIADGHALGRWRIDVIPDRPPTIGFAAPPSRTPRGAIKFAVHGTDDYGVAKLEVVLTPRHGVLRTPLRIDLPVDDNHARTLDETVYKDLTEHPYAGSEVSAVLSATDAAGHSATSKPVTFTLPERVFTDPLARALVEQRRDLALGDVASLPDVQRVLDALTIAPEHFYADRPNIYLAIRSAFWGLRTARVRADIERVKDLLWQTALALDQHGAALLAEQLRQLQGMIAQALANGASPDQIEALLERYRQVMNQYLALMEQQAPQTAQNTPPPGAKTLSDQDLEAMLKAIQQLTETGARGQAMQMMALLQNLIENLHMQAGQGGAGGQSAEDKAAGEAMRKLGDLLGQQRELLDKTYREAQGEGNPADGGARGLSKRQGQLKDGLGDVMKGLGQGGIKPPQNLSDAGRAMGEAQGELSSKDFGSASEAQKEVLDDLRKGVGELASRMQGGGKTGQTAGSQDPFGRPEGARGSISGDNVKLPDQTTLARAREILKELRKRAGELNRPKEELDYIDRLLKQF